MAVANESGYGAFLPKFRNELVDREALRGQMVKQASYLSEMDSIYAQLEENARQFGLDLDYRNRVLEQNAEQFEQEMKLGWAGLDVQRSKIRSDERVSMRGLDLSEEQMEMEADAYGDTRDLLRDLYGSSGRGSGSVSVRGSGSAINIPSSSTSTRQIYSKAAGGFVNEKDYVKPVYDYSGGYGENVRVFDPSGTELNYAGIF